MTEKEYNAAPGVRRSELWRMRESPEKYRYFLEHPEPATPALVFGTAAHKMLLEPGTFWDDFICAPETDRRTKAGKEEWERFAAYLSTVDKTVIQKADVETIRAMREKALSVPYVAELLKGKKEQAFFWTDADTGIPCKVRVDILSEHDGQVVIADYKTTNCAMTDVFNSSVYKYGYHLQAYMYTEAVMQNMGLAERPDFIFIVQEKKIPHALNVIQVTEDVMLSGMDCFREYMGILKECTDTGFWWGYNGKFSEPNELYLPGFMSLGKEEDE